MGAPGKIVRELDAAALADIAETARHYVENIVRYRSGFRPVPA